MLLVTHGLMSRIFLMKWYHFSVEYFEDLRNVGHCEFLIMRKQDSGKYKLENKLRTWSELRRQRELAYKEAAEKEAAEEGGEAGGSTAVAERPKDGYQLQRKMSTSAAPRRWGGCPNGCTHTMHYKPRRDLDELVSRDTNSRTTANGGTGSGSGSGAASPAPGATIATRRQYNAYGSRRVHAYNSEDDPDDPRGEPEKSNDGSTEAGSSNEKAGPRPIDTLKAREELVSSPDGTPSFITVEDRLRSQLRSPTMGLHSHSHHSSPHPSHHCHHRHHHHHSHACSRSRSVGGNSSTAHHDIMHLHVGRDGGGTYSGHASQDDYSSDSDHCHHDGTCGKDGEECRGAEVDIADAKQQLAAKAARVKAGSSRNKLALLTSSTAGVSSGNNGSTPTTAVLRGGHAGGVQDSDDGDVESFDDSRHQDISRARANRLGDAPLSSDIGSEGGDTGSVPDSPLSPRTTHASTLAVPLAVKPENKKKKKASMVVVAAADAAAGDCGNGSNAHDEAAHDAEDEEDEDDLVCVEREEKSVMGSVF